MFGIIPELDTGLLRAEYTLDDTNPLNDKCAYLARIDSLKPKNLAKKDNLGTPGSTGVVRATSLGDGYGVTTNQTSQMQIYPDTDDLLDNEVNNMTFVIMRQKTDATARSSMLFGYDASSSNRVLAHCPWSDGNIYWDFGSSSTGRLSVSGQAWNTNVDYMIFIAGSTKGREVWRNGNKIGSNTGITATRPGWNQPFYLGSNSTGLNSDSETFLLFGIYLREWTDAECRAWFDNPWQLFKPSSTGLIFPTASGISGTSDTTNANDTSSASGTTTIIGTVSNTNANDTSSANGTTTIIGTSSSVNVNDTSNASGTVGSGVSGSSSTINNNDSVSASGTTTVTGTLAKTNANDLINANGWAGIFTGTVSYTNINDSISASGIVGSGIVGTCNVINNNDICLSYGNVFNGEWIKKEYNSQSWTSVNQSSNWTKVR